MGKGNCLHAGKLPLPLPVFSVCGLSLSFEPTVVLASQKGMFHPIFDRCCSLQTGPGWAESGCRRCGTQMSAPPLQADIGDGPLGFTLDGMVWPKAALHPQ